MSSSPPSLEVMRHSLSHILAMAVLQLWPNTKLGIGPVTENGFYYDFEFSEEISPSELSQIETEMSRIIKKGLPFIKRKLTLSEAKKLFQKLNQPYKLELLKDIEEYGTTFKKDIGRGKKKTPSKEGKVNVYESDNLIDLCRGPHLKNTKAVGVFKLTHLAGAYWRGSEKNKMLTRIYGLGFREKKDLKQYLVNQSLAEKRDHRLLGQELDLFSIDEEVGQGLPLWHPKGAMLRQIIEDFWIKEHLKNGYELVRTPHIGHLQLWETSGHWGFYQENMYAPIEIDDQKYILKPMNCPFHIKIYKSKIRSYRDLPIRWAELGTVYRYERSGVLSGLVRLRGFTQDDAHILCRSDQFEEELKKVLKFIRLILSKFGFKDYNVYLSARDLKDTKKYIGDKKVWDFAEKALEKILKQTDFDYRIDYGEAKFYGPAVDIKIKDALGREWQCSTLQLDLNLPAMFQMEFINQRGKPEVPIMLHRALLGSLERFVAVLIEHYAGAFPLWLSPIQIEIIPVGSHHRKSAKALLNKFEENDIRSYLDDLNETVGYKIRKAEKQKVPYMLVIGDKEAGGKNLTVRQRGSKKVSEMSVGRFIEKVKEEVAKFK